MKKNWIILPVIMLAVSFLLMGCDDNKKGKDVPYVVPTSSNSDVFYLDLNDYKTAGAIVGTVPKGTLSADKLKLEMTTNDQRVHFALTEEQLDKVASSIALNVEIDGTATPDSKFRYHFTDPQASSNWNGTVSINEGALSTILNNDLEFQGHQADRTKLGFFSLQLRENRTTTVEIKSIKVTVTTSDPNAGCPSAGEDEKCDGLWMIGCECKPCLCEIVGTPLEFAGFGTNYPGLAISSSPSINLVDGALFIYNRANDYSCIDLNIQSSEEAAEWDVSVDPAKTYSLTVKGKAAVGETAVITIAASPWTRYIEVEIEEEDEGGTPGIGSYTTTLEKTGTELISPAIRLRVEGTAKYMIESIVLEELDADGKPTETKPINFTTFNLD